LALFVVACYVLLEAAFMLVRIPPDSVASVPTGELVIAFFVVTAVVDHQLFMPFFRSIPLIAFLVWWLVGATQLVIGVSDHGFWAMRDATSLLESLFLWVGFVAASAPDGVSKIFRWFYRILILAVCIALTYPFREFVTSISPVIISAVQIPTPIFFTYQLAPLTSLVAALYLFSANSRVLGVHSSWLAAAVMVFVAALFQSRTVYLQIVAVLVLLAFTKRGSLLNVLVPVTLSVGLFLAAVALGVPVPGRLSQNVSLSFYFEHFLAIGGGGSERTGLEDEAIRGAASGVGQRLLWWRVIWEHVCATWSGLLFGLGYGISLVGLAQDPFIDPSVREPHNSLVSALGRTGFVGLTAYIWLHVSLAITLFRTHWYYRCNDNSEVAQFIYVLGGLFMLYWLAAIGEDAFEKPFVAISYYFFYGVILNLYYRAAYPIGDSDSMPLDNKGV
jgi:hypothetical protein